MTRIYTNVPSLTAQRALQRNMGALETSLQRLSTGLRINSGKDDPAGLIASEILRSEITGAKQAITNTERANNVIATADSALSEISNLLNSIRGLVNESASTGTMSAEMLQANQDQIDFMLQSIDRISSNTNFMGRKLLDGSLDFEIKNLQRQAIQNLAVTQAQFGDKGSIDVQVTVREAAEKAALYYDRSVATEDVVLSIGGNLGRVVQTFSKGSTVAEIAEYVNATSSSTGVKAVVESDATYGRLVTSSVGKNNDILITAGTAGINGGFVEVKYSAGSSDGINVVYNESLGPGYPATIDVQLQTLAWEKARATHVDSTPGVHDNNALEFIANIAGDKYNNVSINYVNGNLVNGKFGSAENPSGIKHGVNAVYNDGATNATAVLGDVNGLRAFENLVGTGQYMTLTSTSTGTSMNNVRIEFVNDASRAIIPPGMNAYAAPTLTSDPLNGNEKVFRVYVDASGTTPGSTVTTFSDIQKAIDASGLFTMTMSDGTMGTKAIGVDDCATAGASPNSTLNKNAIYGNTDNSGGDAGTLFVYMNTYLPGVDPLNLNPNGANPPAPSLTYINPVLNKPITSTTVPTFANFQAGDSFQLYSTKAGYNNTKLTFEVAGANDNIFLDSAGNSRGNVVAQYDGDLGTLKVYIKSQDNFAPPLNGAGITRVTFNDIKTAIQNTTAINDPLFVQGTFDVDLNGTNATSTSATSTTNIITLADLTYPQAAKIPFIYTNPANSADIYFRDSTGTAIKNIQFVAVDAKLPGGATPNPVLGKSGTVTNTVPKVGVQIEPGTNSLIVYVDKAAPLPTYANIQTAISEFTNIEPVKISVDPTNPNDPNYSRLGNSGAVPPVPDVGVSYDYRTSSYTVYQATGVTSPQADIDRALNAYAKLNNIEIPPVTAGNFVLDITNPTGTGAATSIDVRDTIREYQLASGSVGTPATAPLAFSKATIDGTFSATFPPALGTGALTTVNVTFSTGALPGTLAWGKFGTNTPPAGPGIPANVAIGYVAATGTLTVHVGDGLGGNPPIPTWGEIQQALALFADTGTGVAAGGITSTFTGLGNNGTGNMAKIPVNTASLAAFGGPGLATGAPVSIGTFTFPLGTVDLNSTFPSPVAVRFVAVDFKEANLLAPGADMAAEFSICVPHTITVYLRKNSDGSGSGLKDITLGEIDDALRKIIVPESTNPQPGTSGSGYFSLSFTNPLDKDALFKLEDTGFAFPVNSDPEVGVTQTIYTIHSANDIKDAFDLDMPQSKGNERAAGFFTVYRSRDNDGTGAIRSYVFEDVFKGGVNGGTVVSTAEEVVAALNNSKYWGTDMTKE
ncbi:MAG: flagellin hook IN motif-containing protein, partial [Thermoguttaceae bacterium]